uniref:EGF-like domain-containing protein n=1 Tax=Macrostomum lignano TaxID=282301 RepID=A0A1I8GEM1_9PLAT
MKPSLLTTVASILATIVLMLMLSRPVEAAYKEVTFGKFMLYEQLRIYRTKYGVSGYYDSTKDTLVLNKSQESDLPAVPSIDLVQDSNRLSSKLAVSNIDLPRVAYQIFNGLCQGDNGTFAWGVRSGHSSVPRYIKNGWTVKNVPQGYLVPMCVCNGRPAVHRVITRLANFEPFVPLLDKGFSHLSTIVMESCREHSRIEVYWPPGCIDCKLETTRTCTVVSKNNESANVMCNCYHGFDPVSKCFNIADRCTERVTPHSAETGRDLCQADIGNKCTTDGDTYMCTCFMPYFENKTVSNFPNCRGSRGKGRGAAAKLAARKCQSKVCGNGVCVGRERDVECKCDEGYAGHDCREIFSTLSDWSEWSDCFPACGNIGGQFRQRPCQSADSDGRFCEGFRRQHRRCQPARCFENESFPIFVRSLHDPLPASLYIRSAAVFIGTFLFVYCLGLLIALGFNFQDWKLESVNQAGKLAYAVDQVCDELMIRHAELEAHRRQDRIEKLKRGRKKGGNDASYADDADNDEEESDDEDDLQGEILGESEDFFRMGVFVPHPVVDHLTGVSSLQRRRLRQAKLSKTEKKKPTEQDGKKSLSEPPQFQPACSEIRNCLTTMGIRYGDIDQLLEDVLLSPSNHHRPLHVSSVGGKASDGDVYAEVNKETPAGVHQAKKLPASSNTAPDGIEYQLERLRRLTTTGRDSVGKRCQSYEVLERVSSFRVHPPLPPPPTSTSNQLTNAFAASDCEDENVEYATEVTALRPIGKGIHTLKSYSRIRNPGPHGQQQPQPFTQWQRNRLHQSTPSLQPTQANADSPHLGGLRTVTLKASSGQQHHNAASESKNTHQSRLHQHQIEGAIAQLTAEAQASNTAGPERTKPSEARRADAILESVKATCRLWYQPSLSRNEASSRLINQAAGSFLIRRSANHSGSLDLVVRAPEASPRSDTRPILHLLVERRCFNNTVSFVIAGDPVDKVNASLSELVTANTRPGSVSAQLPCPLRLPTALPSSTIASSTRIECSALYLAAVDVETATGAAALARATEALMRCRHRLRPRPCRLMACAKPRPGIRVVFDDGVEEEKYLPASCVLHCGYDPCQRSFDSDDAVEVGVGRPRIFGFVLRNRSDRVDNCVLLACDDMDVCRAASLVQSVRMWLGL